MTKIEKTAQESQKPDPKCKDGCTCDTKNTSPHSPNDASLAEKLQKELDAARTKAEENLNLAKYHKAEFENYKKQRGEAAQSAFNDGRNYVLINMLPVLDAISEASKVITGAESKAGIDILKRKFEEILIRCGLVEIETKPGDQFDPHKHNAAFAENVAGKPSGIILEVWQKGYKLDSRVVRPATVKVSQ